MSKKIYLSDGAYAEDDGLYITVSAEREGDTHYVALDSEGIEMLLRFIEKQRGVKITVTRPD